MCFQVTSFHSFVTNTVAFHFCPSCIFNVGFPHNPLWKKEKQHTYASFLLTAQYPCDKCVCVTPLKCSEHVEITYWWQLCILRIDFALDAWTLFSSQVKSVVNHICCICWRCVCTSKVCRQNSIWFTDVYEIASWERAILKLSEVSLTFPLIKIIQYIKLSSLP